MKLKLILFSLIAVTLSAVLSAVAINRRLQTQADRQTFTVKGVVIEMPNDVEDSIRIQHEEIPNYMPAMVMPFSVKSRALLKGLKVGDAINFDFVVTEDDSWISRIRKTGVAEPGSIAPEPAATDEIEQIEIGQPVGDISLIDQDGRPFNLRDYKGRAVLVTFIYTRCPIPNYCPLMSKNFAALQERFSKDLPGRVQLLTITMDPAFDQPEILKTYAARYNANARDWTFATGTPDQIDAVTGMFGIRRQWEGGLISHNLSTALISPDGRLIHVWKSNVWTPYEVHRRVKEMFGT